MNADTKKVAFYTFGCKLNYSETSAIGRRFLDAGFEKVAFEEPADVYLINTCSVTEQADQKCRHLVSRTRRQAPDARIVVIGCYAQLQPETIAKFEGVDLVLGASEKFKVVDYLANMGAKKEVAEVHSCSIDEVDFFENAYSFGDRTRTFLKVQDGCDYGCAFCTIPMARGRSRSPLIASIVKNAEDIAAQGVKEVVLTGVNIGDFGKGESGGRRKQENFLDLVMALDEVAGIERFRISSIEPNLLNEDIIRFVASSKRFMPHFHIPLQSGSNRILNLMRRRYRRELYAERVALIKQHMPHCCIGVDVIVGFPGETEEDFMETYQFVHSLDVSYLHVFTYSERPNTLAMEMAGKVPVQERRKRNKMLTDLSNKKRRYFYSLHEGQERTVLFEGENEEGWMHGFTDNYIKVKQPFDAAQVNRLTKVTLGATDDDGTIPAREAALEYSIFQQPPL
ncbi:MAG: tRNA (N(6)-L-threonylcarbamoyladenosine(37)-C(2))-methylthiotransferase MtaB [Chitinophagales bacterium]|nr:tRNA (N(6)-L-threonylcarbamoyladenosine(37)-C(2))-methylthiotransferase MtaB [Chitinophagales bacterium]